MPVRLDALRRTKDGYDNMDTYRKLTDNEIETLWLHDRIVFINDPLYKVFDVLQRCFGVQIECSDNVNLSDRYTATFKDKRISDILEVIKMHYGFSYEHDGHIIRIDR
jgi:ferric-dicitrate binding protein FerR (iron transport regulator)